MIHVFQLDADTAFLAAMEDHCSRIEDLDYRGTSSALSFCATLEEDRLDIVLLDLDIKPGGALFILEEIRARFSSDEVKVIVFTAETGSENALIATTRWGADYVCQRPVDIIVLETRIRQLVGDPLEQCAASMTRRQVQEVCARFFERMGIPPHFKGYRYLIEGIWLASLNPAWLNSVTQHLYPAIAQRFEVSASQVERAMRYALDVTWEKGNMDELYGFFPYVLENKGKPTSSAFIAKMVGMVGFAIS